MNSVCENCRSDESDGVDIPDDEPDIIIGNVADVLGI